MHEMIHVIQQKINQVASLEDKKPRTKILHKSDICSINNIYHIFNKCEMNGLVFEVEMEKNLRAVNKFMISKYGCSIIKERDAQSQSFGMLDCILSKYGSTYLHLRKYLQINRDFFNLMGYEINNNNIESPAYNVMKFMLKNDLTSNENLEWMDNNPEIALHNAIKMFPDMFSRFSMGLPITPHEHAVLASRCNQAIDEGYIHQMYSKTFYDGENIDI